MNLHLKNNCLEIPVSVRTGRLALVSLVKSQGVFVFDKITKGAIMKTVAKKKRNGIQNISIEERVKTIHWKFADVSESYPQLYSVKDTKINTSIDFYNTFKFLFDHEVQEKFVVFWLSTSNMVIGYEVVSIGTLNQSLVSAREVFRGAIVSSCSSIILAHNHPSGALEPSPEDISTTNKLVYAGNIIEIKVLDHFIFTNISYCSLYERGLIK